MSNCCIIPHKGSIPVCPMSGQVTRPVGRKTVESLVKAEFTATLRPQPYYFCNAPDCVLCSHGTHVAGIIGAIGNNALGVVGVNWECKIVALKFFDMFGRGFTSAAVDAMQYVIDNDIKVSNNSWGSTTSSQSLFDVIQASQAIGHIFVAAAMNANSDNDTVPFYPCSYDLDNIICVAATRSDDQRALFSNYGATTVDLGAPGDPRHPA